MKPKRREPSGRSPAGSIPEARPNEPRQVTAARWRMLLNVNGHGGAAAPARMGWTPPSGVSVTI